MNKEPAAFPHINPPFDDNWNKHRQHSGMTLRDYFAAKAMQGITATDTYTTEDTAQIAYEQADAMLKARDNK